MKARKHRYYDGAPRFINNLELKRKSRSWCCRVCVFEHLAAVDRTTWGGLASMALMEEVCHMGWALWFQKILAISRVFFCLVIVDQDVSF